MSEAISLIERNDGTITNDTGGDPAVAQVLGHRRYWIGCDLGQSHDFSSTVVIEDEQLPTMQDGVCVLGPRTLTVVFADKFRGASYVAVADYLVRLRNAVPFAGKSKLVIDGTGLGRVMSDLLNDQGIDHLAVQFTSGQEWRRSGRYINASKTLMVENTAVLFSTGELTFAHDLPMRNELEAELASFTVQTTAAGNSVIGQSRTASGHGDAAISLIIGCFAAQYLKPQTVGQAKLRGWF